MGSTSRLSYRTLFLGAFSASGCSPPLGGKRRSEIWAGSVRKALGPPPARRSCSRGSTLAFWCSPNWTRRRWIPPRRASGTDAPEASPAPRTAGRRRCCRPLLATARRPGHPATCRRIEVGANNAERVCLEMADGTANNEQLSPSALSHLALQWRTISHVAKPSTSHLARSATCGNQLTTTSLLFFTNNEPCWHVVAGTSVRCRMETSPRGQLMQDCTTWANCAESTEWCLAITVGLRTNRVVSLSLQDFQQSLTRSGLQSNGARFVLMSVFDSSERLPPPNKNTKKTDTARAHLRATFARRSGAAREHPLLRQTLVRAISALTEEALKDVSGPNSTASRSSYENNSGLQALGNVVTP